jgi:hypothetical protein
MDRFVALQVDTRLEMHAQTNIGLLCCVGSVTKCSRMRWSAAARLVRLRVRIPQGSRTLSLMNYVGCADRCLCEGPIPCSGESYRVWCVSMCAIRRSNNHLQLQRVGRRGMTERNVFNCDFLVVSQLGDHVTLSSRLKFRRKTYFAALYLTEHFRVKTPIYLSVSSNLFIISNDR